MKSAPVIGICNEPSFPNTNIDEYKGKGVELIGWGAKDITGAVSAKLKRIEIKVFPMR
jgi:hypothetical protein